MADSAPAPLPWWKKTAFAILLISLFFAGLEGILALFGIRPVLYEQDPHVGFASNIPLFVKETRADGSAFMVRAENKADYFNHQEFPAVKGKGTYRIFCVGGSTTYGRPFGDNSSFCGWLRELLPAVDDSKTWEVINAGGISYASYRVALLMEELVNYQPDVFVIYTGHNEFLERRTYAGTLATPKSVRGLATLASKTRTSAGLKRLLPRKPAAPAASGTVPLLSAEVKTLLDHSIGPTAYTRDDKLQEDVLSHFHYNLDRMLRIARSAGARVVFIAPASNLRDCTPFKSEHREGFVQQVAWREAMRRGQQAVDQRRFEDALVALDQALALDSRHALTWFLRGRVLEDLGRPEEARQAYRRARDEDVCPLRALTAMPGMVRQVARDWNAGFIDYVAELEARSKNGLPGKHQFLDHVHPTIEEHRNLAVLLVEQLAAQGAVTLSAAWREDPPSIIEAASSRVEGRIDAGVHGRAMVNLSKVMGWAGKVQDAYTAAQGAVKRTPAWSEAHFHLASNALKLGKVDEAVLHFRKVLELGPEEGATYLETLNNLGVIFSRQGKLDEAEAYYRKAVDSDPRMAQAHYNLGIIRRKQGDHSEAISRFRTVLSIEPDHVQAHFQLGPLLLDVDVPAAIRHLEQVARLRPADPTGLDRLAVAYFQARRQKEAVAACSKALQLARSQGATRLAGEIEARLKTYRRGLTP